MGLEEGTGCGELVHLVLRKGRISTYIAEY